ncbi:helix-turn-helix domain-containing protein [Brevundimonas sp.]
MDVCQKLGLRVQQLRQAKGWSQDEFAHRANLHRTYVSGV